MVHSLRGRRSNRKLDENTKKKALEILGREVYSGFGPTLAAEYPAGKHGIHVGRETARTWMIEGGLWRPQKQRVKKIHQWRQRRPRVGELVQWDTSEHAWLEERGPKLYLIGQLYPCRLSAVKSAVSYCGLCGDEQSLAGLGILDPVQAFMLYFSRSALI